MSELTAGYGLVIVDECHHLPAAAFENAVRQIRAKYWAGLTATPYRRDGLDELINHQLGPTRHTISPPPAGTLEASDAPDRLLTVHPTSYEYRGEADPSEPGGMAAIYRDLVADGERSAQLSAMFWRRSIVVGTVWSSHSGKATSMCSLSCCEMVGGSRWFSVAVWASGSGPLRWPVSNPPTARCWP